MLCSLVNLSFVVAVPATILAIGEEKITHFLPSAFFLELQDKASARRFSGDYTRLQAAHQGCWGWDANPFRPAHICIV
jgi:hypothetical protein